MRQTVLRTARLTLRPFEDRDIDPLHEILSDMRIMRYWDDVHASREATRRFVLGTMSAPADESCDFVIECDGLVIGKCGMWKKPEIGFFVHPDFQRRGYAREALLTTIPLLFTTYDMDALTADVDPRNEASLALLTSIGFVETHRATGTMTMHGELCDSVYLALTRG